jgi:hypothetical protein
MILVNPRTIGPQINKCYLEYDPHYPIDMHNRVPAFKYYIERTGGMKLDFEPKIDPSGRYSYQLNRVEVVDEKKYTMFLLKYSV